MENLSNEIRWFYKQPNDNISSWFNKHKTTVLIDTEKRTDYYLVTKPYTNISFKLRDSKTEIKMKVGGDKDFKYEGKVKKISGKINKWHKWSLQLKEKIENVESLYTGYTNKFVEIKKMRDLITLEICNPNECKISNNNYLKEGCQIELTSLFFNNENWFSFGLESFGENAETNLQLALKFVIDDLDEVNLDYENSYSYPEFLCSDLIK